jgi:hypothetical protein
MPLTYEFQQRNNPKHAAKVVKNWFREEKIKVGLTVSLPERN